MDYGEMWGALWKTAFQVTFTYTNLYAVPESQSREAQRPNYHPARYINVNHTEGAKRSIGVFIIIWWCASGTETPPYLNRGHAMSIRLSLYDISLPCGCCHGKEQSRPLSQGAQQMGGTRSQHTRALSKRHRASPSGQSL